MLHRSNTNQGAQLAASKKSSSRNFSSPALSPLDILNEDVILHLATNVIDAATLAKCTIVNKRLHQAFGGDFVWKRKLINDYGADWQNVLSFMERKSISTGRGIDYQFAYGLLAAPRITVRRPSAFNISGNSQAPSRTVVVSVVGEAGTGKSTFINTLNDRPSSSLSRSLPTKVSAPSFGPEPLCSSVFLETMDSDDLIQCNFIEGPVSQCSDTHAAVILIDLTDRRSFCNAKETWRSFMASFEEEKQPRCIVVGTKADVTSRRNVSESEARELASSLRCRYVETTIASKASFEHALCQLISTVIERQPLLIEMDKIVSREQLPPMINKMAHDTKLKSKKSKFGLRVASLLRKSITGI